MPGRVVVKVEERERKEDAVKVVKGGGEGGLGGGRGNEVPEGAGAMEERERETFNQRVL